MYFCLPSHNEIHSFQPSHNKVPHSFHIISGKSQTTFLKKTKKQGSTKERHITWAFYKTFPESTRLIPIGNPLLASRRGCQIEIYIYFSINVSDRCVCAVLADIISVEISFLCLKWIATWNPNRKDLYFLAFHGSQYLSLKTRQFLFSLLAE